LMAFLGVMAVFLSGFLIVNTTSALMAQQVRQIGVMKALGASIFQLIGMYLVLVLAFGLLALLVAVPLSGLAAYGLSRWMIGMLNADPTPFSIPSISVWLQVIIALGVPVFAALAPVLGGARLTVREAISNYGLSKPGSHNLFDRLLESVRGLPRPLLLSLRNTFNRKTRLLLTLATLILAGAIFMAVLSVRESMHIEVARTFGYYQTDVNVEFSSPQDFTEVSEAIKDVPGVSLVEGWNTSRVNIMHTDGVNSDQVVVYAPPANTRLVTPAMSEGRWLLPTDTNAIVVDNHFVKARPDVKIGDEIHVRIGKEEYPFVVVGFFRLASNQAMPFTFINNEYLAQKTGMDNRVSSLRILTSAHDAAFQNTVLNSLQARFDEKSIQAVMQIGSEALSQSMAQTDLIIYLLLFMAVLIAVVGGLGLTGTMSMNVLERTREIGVMRSIGAESGAISQMVVFEGLLVGVLSWVLCIPLAIPMTHFLDDRLGTMLMTLPLFYTLSTRGIFVWLAIVLILATIASLLPARNATRLTIRDVLAYE
jgi:putative ABC transport system permease protein